MSLLNQCPACGASELDTFYTLSSVPVHSVLLLPTREEALNYPRGDIALAFCRACGMITNAAFDPSKHEYSERYEETQGFSDTFNEFHRRLAQSLIERYDLHGKRIIEIGCGKGEFITLLAALGDNQGIGFDPAYVPGRARWDQELGKEADVTFIADFYGEKYAHEQADLYVCKMTLEHIQDVYEFVSTVRRSVGDKQDAVVFFQIPDVRRILAEQAFWDIYYEHCSYFSPGSLARLFRRAGFDVTDLWTDYGDQYLMIEARPGSGTGTPPLPGEDDLAEVSAAVETFREALPGTLQRWRERVRTAAGAGQSVVLWGGGSKGVAFLTTLGIQDEIQYAVDINPNKSNTFMAGTGQRIVPPLFLLTAHPDLVVVMNPIYKEEIRAQLEGMNITSATLVSVDE